MRHKKNKTSQVVFVCILFVVVTKIVNMINTHRIVLLCFATCLLIETELKMKTLQWKMILHKVQWGFLTTKGTMGHCLDEQQPVVFDIMFFYHVLTYGYCKKCSNVWTKGRLLASKHGSQHVGLKIFFKENKKDKNIFVNVSWGRKLIQPVCQSSGKPTLFFFSKCKFKCENSTRYLQEHFIKCGHYNSVGYHKVLHTLQ